MNLQKGKSKTAQNKTPNQENLSSSNKNPKRNLLTPCRRIGLGRKRVLQSPVNNETEQKDDDLTEKVSVNTSINKELSVNISISIKNDKDQSKNDRQTKRNQKLHYEESNDENSHNEDETVADQPLDEPSSKAKKSKRIPTPVTNANENPKSSSTQESSRGRKPFLGIRRNPSSTSVPKIQIKSVVTVNNGDFIGLRERNETTTEHNYESEAESVLTPENNDVPIKVEPNTDNDEPVSQNVDSYDSEPLAKTRRTPTEQKRKRTKMDKKSKLLQSTRSSASPLTQGTPDSRGVCSPAGSDSDDFKQRKSAKSDKAKSRRRASEARSSPVQHVTADTDSDSERESPPRKIAKLGRYRTVAAESRDAPSPKQAPPDRAAHLSSDSDFEDRIERNRNFSPFLTTEKGKPKGRTVESRAAASPKQADQQDSVGECDSDNEPISRKIIRIEKEKSKKSPSEVPSEPTSNLTSGFASGSSPLPPSDSDDDFVRKPKREQIKSEDESQAPVKQESAMRRRIKKRKTFTVYDAFNRTENYRLSDSRSYTVIQRGDTISYVKAYNLHVGPTQRPAEAGGASASMIQERRCYKLDKDTQDGLALTPSFYDELSFIEEGRLLQASRAEAAPLPVPPGGTEHGPRIVTNALSPLRTDSKKQIISGGRAAKALQIVDKEMSRKQSEETPQQVRSEIRRQELTETPRRELAETLRREFSETPRRELLETPRQEMKETLRRELAETPETPRQELTETPSRELAETPRRELTETPGQELAETPGQELAETPRRELSETQRKELVETQINELAETQRKELAETQIKEFAETQRKELAKTQIKDLTETQKNELNEIPRKGLTDTPAQELRETPVKEFTDTPGEEPAETRREEVTESPEINKEHVENKPESPETDTREPPGTPESSQTETTQSKLHNSLAKMEEDKRIEEEIKESTLKKNEEALQKKLSSTPEKKNFIVTTREPHKLSRGELEKKLLRDLEKKLNEYSQENLMKQEVVRERIKQDLKSYGEFERNLNLATGNKTIEGKQKIDEYSKRAEDILKKCSPSSQSADSQHASTASTDGMAERSRQESEPEGGYNVKLQNTLKRPKDKSSTVQEIFDNNQDMKGNRSAEPDKGPEEECKKQKVATEDKSVVEEPKPGTSKEDSSSDSGSSTSDEELKATKDKILQLKFTLKKKQDNLRRLKNINILKKKHNLETVNGEKMRIRESCIGMLFSILDLLKRHSDANIDMGTLLTNMEIPYHKIGFNEDEDSFL